MNLLVRRWSRPKQLSDENGRKGRAVRRAVICGVAALLGGAAVIATSPTASAATAVWRVDFGGAESVYIVAPQDDGVCLNAPKEYEDEVGATVTTLAFPGPDCRSAGGVGEEPGPAPVQCNTTVQSNVVPTNFLNVSTCWWLGT